MFSACEYFLPFQVCVKFSPLVYNITLFTRKVNKHQEKQTCGSREGPVVSCDYGFLWIASYTWCTVRSRLALQRLALWFAVLMIGKQHVCSAETAGDGHLPDCALCCSPCCYRAQSTEALGCHSRQELDWSHMLQKSSWETAFSCKTTEKKCLSIRCGLYKCSGGALPPMCMDEVPLSPVWLPTVPSVVTTLCVYKWMGEMRTTYFLYVYSTWPVKLVYI